MLIRENRLYLCSIHAVEIELQMPLRRRSDADLTDGDFSRGREGKMQSERREIEALEPDELRRNRSEKIEEKERK